MAAATWTNPRCGQWFVSAGGTRWWFESGSIALDFAYTGSMGDNPLWEQWHAPEDLAAWLADRFGIRVPTGQGDLHSAKQLREAIATLVYDALTGRPRNADAATTIDRYAAAPDVAPQLRERRPHTVEQVLSTLAREAVVLLRDSADRIRECTAGDCRVVYVDTSRSANRTWCSMQRCGNRNKARQQRSRHKHVQLPEGDTS